VDPQVLLVNLLRMMGEREAALEAAQALDTQQPSSISKGLVGLLTLQGGDPQAAVELLAEALELDPYVSRTWDPYLQGIFMLGDMERLEGEVDRALALIPDLDTALAMQGVLMVMRGENDAAEPQLRAVLESNPAQPFANQYLGVALRAQGRITEAEFFLAEEVHHFGSLPSRMQLVEIYADQQRYQEQLEQLQAIAAQEPPSFLTYHSIGQCLFNLARYEEAQAAVDTCRELAPEYPACAMLEANVLKRLGKEDEAQAAYQRALRLGDEAKQRRATPPEM
jgi:tetratricopeptide (TPR) repeat protein